MSKSSKREELRLAFSIITRRRKLEDLSPQELEMLGLDSYRGKPNDSFIFIIAETLIIDAILHE